MSICVRWISHPIQKYTLSAIRSFCTKNPLPKSLNETKLIGTVSTDVFTNSLNKSKVFYLRTFNQEFYDTHKVSVSHYMIQSLPGTPKTGQKLLITGRLRTKQFIRDNGKKATGIKIMARQIYLCDDGQTENIQAIPNEDGEYNKVDANISNVSNKNGKFDVRDQNQVELLAYICFDIHNEDAFSSFSLALHYHAKNVDGVDEEQTDFISVFVYDDTLRNIVRNQLKRLDRVRVEGVLKYKACIDDTGKKQYQGYILANRIAKLMKLQRIVDTEAQLLKEQAIE